jgi:23S rRNA (adenine2503-C2)-methyltransferase
MKKNNLKGLTLSRLEEFAVSLGEKKFRGKQLFDWIYTKGASSFGEMTTFAKPLRERLEQTAELHWLKPVRQQVSASGGTTKFLFELHDGQRIESVLIPPSTAFNDPSAESEEEQQRLTLCISTQIGCALNCAFCATATMGFARNLTAGEIVDQIFEVRKIACRKITNLVYMGMGEPLLNYDEVMDSVEVVSTGMGIAARRITVSTAGWADGIRRIADERRKMKLAISLHSLDEKVRCDLMPVTKKFPLQTLLDSIQYYYRALKRRVTFEYILFDGWNDSNEDLARLIKLAKTIPCKINIIPFHSIAFTDAAGLAARLKPTPPRKAGEFVKKLREAHCTVFVRSSAGEDIDAACGQLAVRTGRERNRSNEKRKTTPQSSAAS